MEFIASPLMRVSLMCMAWHGTARHGMADKTRLNVRIAIYKKIAKKPGHKQSLILPQVS
jgi:hypothetical protein